MLHRACLGLVIAIVSAAAGATAVRAEGDVRNGLSSVAFRRNTLTTNHTSLELLLGNPLGDALLTHPYLALQLHQDRAQAVMHELVRCALGPDDVITYVDPIAQAAQSPDATHRWRGELGLCRGGEAEDWKTAPPSVMCQELVTACLAARVNGLGKAVPVSLRGQAPSLASPAAAIRQVARYRERLAGTDPAVGILVGSFKDPPCAADRDCGWKPGQVGRCTAGTPVTITSDDPVACHTPVRVCTGLHGCLGAASGWKLPDDFPAPPYSTLIEEATAVCAGAPLTFACPAEGTFSVMVGPPGPGGTPLAPVVDVTDGPGYPASETAVFDFREGAFFGNLFEPGMLTRDCSVTAADPEHAECVSLDDTPVPVCRAAMVAGCDDPEHTVPYRQLYACFTAAQQRDANGDDLGAAYFNDRICNEPDPDFKCFPHRPTRCFFQDPTVNQAHGAHCSWDQDRGVFYDCVGADGNATAKPYHPITTYLDDPCNLIRDPALCAALRSVVDRGETAGVRGVSRGSHGCGCASGGPGGSGGSGGDAVGSLLLAAVVAGRVRRRRRVSARRSA